VLVKKCGYKGRTPYWDWTQGTVDTLTRPGEGDRFDDFHLDAHDVYNSNLFNDSSSGVGGWGDPANDYQISTGGLKDMVVAYPSPHHIRRNFTLFPFADPNFPSRFPGDPNAPQLPKDMMINTTMTKEKVDALVNGYEGDFIGFQADLESVSANPTLKPKFSIVLTRPHRASMAAPISSWLGERVVAPGSLPHLVTDKLPKGFEWYLSQ